MFCQIKDLLAQKKRVTPSFFELTLSQNFNVLPANNADDINNP